MVWRGLTVRLSPSFLYHKKCVPLHQQNHPKKMNSKKTVTTIYILSGIVILFFAFYYIATPRSSDEYALLTGLKEYGTDDTGCFNFWQGMKLHTIDRYNFDNVRIPQILFPALIYLFPRWIIALFTSCLFATILISINKISTAVFKDFGWFTAFMLLFICAIPWHDTMFYTVFQMNYTWPAALMLISIVLLSKGTVAPLWMFLLCLITGLWHETFGITLIGGSILLMICNRRVKADVLAATIGATIAVVFLGLAPGTDVRVEESLSPQLSYIFYHPIGIAYLLLWAWMICRRKWQAIALERHFIIIAGGIGAAILLNILIPYHRVAFTAYLLAAFGLPALLQRVIDIKRLKKVIIVASCLVWCFLIAHLSAAAAGIWRINRNDAELMKILQEAPSEGAVFANIPLPQDFTPLALRKPNTTHYYYPSYSYYYIGKYYNISDFAIFPSAFRSYHGEGIKCPGNTDLVYWQGHLIGPEESIERVNYREIYVKFGSTIKSECIGFHYFTADDGRRWCAAYILRPGLYFWDGTPPEITVAEE